MSNAIPLTRLAFVVDNLGASQASYLLIKKLNTWLAESLRHDGCVFVRHMGSPCSACNFPIFSINDLANYKGICIATSFDAAKELIHIQGPSSIAYYAQDPEWTYQYRPFDEWRAVMLNSKFKIMCRSSYHQDLFKRCWNTSPAIIEDFNIQDIIEESKKG